MDEYVKLSITFRERVLFFLTGLIRKRHIISKTVEPEVYTQADNKIVIPENVDGTPEMGPIPFFELDKSDTKSNL